MVDTVIRRSVVSVDLLGVEAGGVFEEAGERGVLVMLVVRVGGAAQRAEILEHPLGLAAAVGVGQPRVLAPRGWRGLEVGALRAAQVVPVLRQRSHRRAHRRAADQAAMALSTASRRCTATTPRSRGRGR
jgi:hypothetical protein